MTSPWRCRVWDLHDRMFDSLTTQNCSDIIQSIKSEGQLYPAIGRIVRGEPDVDIEIVCGARRLYAAQQLEIDLKVDLKELDDRKALRMMFVENEHRQDISPYERGISLGRLLRTKQFHSQTDLADVLGLSQATVSRLLAFSRLPAVVVEAFPSPTDIREDWAVQLASDCKDKSKSRRVIERARSVVRSKAKLSPKSTYLQLRRAADQVAIEMKHRDQVFRAKDGRVLFRVRETSSGISIFFQRTAVCGDYNAESTGILVDYLRSKGPTTARLRLQK